MNITWKLKYLVAIIGIFIVSTYSFYKMQLFEISEHTAIMNHLGNLRKIDNDLNQDVFKSRYYLLEHYDSLVKMIAEIKLLQKNIEDVVLKDILGKNPEIEKSYKRIKEIMRRKELHIESFKSTNSILRNSIKYFPIVAFEELSKKEKETQNLYQLLSYTLAYNAVDENQWSIEVKKIAKKLQESTNSNISLLVAHSDNIITKKQEVDDIIKNITALPSDEAIQNLTLQYLDFYKSQFAISQQYKNILYMSIIFLMATILWILFKLFSNAKATRPLLEISQHLYKVTQKIEELAVKISETSTWLADNGQKQQHLIEKNNEVLAQIDKMTNEDLMLCKETNHTIENTQNNINKSLDRSKEISAVMTDIKQASYETSSVLESIREVAKQSKLLGLNATIEASRIGNEIFSVVANEISSLASRSTKALGNTNEQITNTQNKSKQANELSNEILSFLSDIDTKVKNIDSNMKNLTNDFEKQKKELHSFGDTIKFSIRSFEKYREIAMENKEIADRLSSFTSTLRNNVAKTLQITRKLENN